MKRYWKWAAAALAVVLLAAGVLRALEARRAQQAAAASAGAPVETVVQLAPADVVRATKRELAQTLAVSGTLRAIDSALVKARVPGELVGLAVREGDTVKAGQVIARIEPAEYESRVRQAREQAESARAQAEVAQRTYDNNKALVEQGFISRTALDTSQSNLNAARSTHRAALAAVEMAHKSLSDTVLTSPLSGQVAQRLAQNGERVSVDARVIEVVDLSRIEVEATVAAADSVAVRVGQRAALQIEGSGGLGPAGAERSVGASVVRVNPSAQAGSRSVLVYLRLDRSEGFRQGLFAQGTLDIGRTEGLALPLSAVRIDKPAPYVQMVIEGRIAHRQVKTGARGQVSGQTLVTVQGIDDGAVVVAGSVGPLREGTAVRLAPATAP
ncbi:MULTISPECIES: efflux RND transporter periplasmic adaptor subunit [unclassified Variovorax]|uniref:efflux RND transporter periplasmic adaptor subunit n=1 Tax=unclassified Variovorax TaxID=663243 RepID=UPI00076D2334|nr:MULTISPECIES: efflux RND transporter periplasmic adaptor subunit [unclassified Variovorax]KWT93197.1 putative Co/Zn/Cd efflux system membrane fusion protein [Variovorax sp. WDL1]PNG47392.1 Macrolide export protein MacA [Variovorax sp. B2]PNG47957.1 Macrolide export protein MacA [Variovorax sp. B4]VTV15302.1 Macrolide-specific efflux protein MacA precursor [Variovorax sp. WDL1]